MAVIEYRGLLNAPEKFWGLQFIDLFREITITFGK